MTQIIFLAGAYGVGKSTLCEKIKDKYNLPVYAASDLISKRNNEVYGVNKYVKDAVENQKILLNEISKIQDECFIINGHFCLKEKNNEINILDEKIFKDMKLSLIILIDAKSHQVVSNLKKRDNKNYDDIIEQILRKEKEQALHISEAYDIPLYIHNIKYDDSDVDAIMDNVLRIVKRVKI